MASNIPLDEEGWGLARRENSREQETFAGVSVEQTMEEPLQQRGGC